MTKTNERVTVDFDSESYYLDGEYWESWDNYGEEMAEKINKLLNEINNENEQFKNKVYLVINKRINVLENDYNKAVKAGMPSNSVYGEIELLEELKKELEE